MERSPENSQWPQRILLASPRGFCAGVIRAVDALNLAVIENPGETIYCYHEIIHNDPVVKDFETRGVIFVNSPDEAPENSIFFFSAHGVSPQIRSQAAQRGMRIIDATCPLVEKTHREANRFLDEGKAVLYIGHGGHDETVGTLGFAPQIQLIENVSDAEKVEAPNPENVALITQTTLSMDDAALIREKILQRFPGVVTPERSDICFATQNRQDGVKAMIAKGAEAVVVVGSTTSSNSTRLKEVAEDHGARAFFVDQASQLEPDSLRVYKSIGLTSGASAPEGKFSEVAELLRSQGTSSFEAVIVADESKIHFPLPKMESLNE